MFGGHRLSPVIPSVSNVPHFGPHMHGSFGASWRAGENKNDGSASDGATQGRALVF